MKKLFLTMASLLMLASMTIAQNETPMLPESHGALTHQPAWGSSQTFDMAAGWTWWSTFISTTDLQTLENALGVNGKTIKYSTGQVQKTASGIWDGTLSSFGLGNMYAIEMTADTSFTLRGSRAAATDVPIDLNIGWNWISYPITFNAPVDYALANYLNAAQGDHIKGQVGISEYNASTQTWVGTLSQLDPGKGYMIESQATASFYYPAVPATEGRAMMTSQNVFDTEWQPKQASNPYNMNMIAVVSLNNEELRSDNVEIGVFNGETCRGAIRPMYVDFLDQYVVFLTMYGESNEPYSFRLLDHETGAIYESDEASVSFKADVVLGRLLSPFELKFNTTGMTASNLNLFPNPVNRGEMVNVTLPNDDNVTVEVINVMGSTVKTMQSAQGSTELSADMAPGIYTVKVTDAQGKVNVAKLVVE